MNFVYGQILRMAHSLLFGRLPSFGPKILTYLFFSMLQNRDKI